MTWLYWLSIALSQLYPLLNGFSNHMHSLIRDNVTFGVLAASCVTFKIETDCEQLCIEWSIMWGSITESSQSEPLQLFVLKWKMGKLVTFTYVQV